MTAIVTRGDAAQLQLPDAVVDLVVTSPPYFGLRSYQDDGEHYAGQIGAETTPAEYLDALVACTAEWMRVLKPGGSIFVNLGDKVSDRAGPSWAGSSDRVTGRPPKPPRSSSTSMAPRKSLLGLPWRYALRCIDELGLILRAEIVWSKPNGLPESVTDRVRRAHEQVFHLVKQADYFAAVDAIREPHAETSIRRAMPHRSDPGRRDAELYQGQNGQTLRLEQMNHPLGRLPSSVWSIPTAPLKVPAELGLDHFAAYPPELVRRIVLGWSPRQVCSACGEGRRPVVERPGLAGGDNNPHSRDGSRTRSELDGGGVQWARRMAQPDYISGHACACPDNTAPSTPGVVLDPFGGTGTTALVASAHGRIGVSVDLSADYCRLARWRTTDPGERARVLGVPKPAPVADAQMTLEGLTP